MNFEPLTSIPETSSTLGCNTPTLNSGGITPIWNANAMVPSGYTIVLPLPLGRTPTDVPTFIIRTTPTYVLMDNKLPYPFFQPVQMVQGVKKKNTPFKILATPTWNPMTVNSQCHRFISGTLGVSLRINATGFTGGNLLVTEHNSLYRDYLASHEVDDPLSYSGFSCYPGLTSNSSAPTAFALNDLSIAKNITIKSPVPDNDVKDMHLIRRIPIVGEFYESGSVYEMYSDSCLAVKIQTDLVSLEPGLLSIDVYFDWSAIRWDYPMFPINTPPNLWSLRSTDVFEKYYHDWPEDDFDKLTPSFKKFSIKDKTTNKNE